MARRGRGSCSSSSCKRLSKKVNTFGIVPSRRGPVPTIGSVVLPERSASEFGIGEPTQDGSAHGASLPLPASSLRTVLEDVAGHVPSAMTLVSEKRRFPISPHFPKSLTLIKCPHLLRQPGNCGFRHHLSELSKFHSFACPALCPHQPVAPDGHRVRQSCLNHCPISCERWHPLLGRAPSLTRC